MDHKKKATLYFICATGVVLAMVVGIILMGVFMSEKYSFGYNAGYETGKAMGPIILLGGGGAGVLIWMGMKEMKKGKN